MKNKEEFYLKNHKFFENNLLREIYNGDTFSICNAVNNCYIIFDYEMCHKNGIPLGIVVQQQYLKSIMQDNITFYNWLSTLSDDEITKSTVVCNDKVFEMMNQEKMRTDLNGPDINLEYEEMLLKEFGKSSYGYR